MRRPTPRRQPHPQRGPPDGMRGRRIRQKQEEGQEHQLHGDQAEADGYAEGGDREQHAQRLRLAHRVHACVEVRHAEHPEDGHGMKEEGGEQEHRDRDIGDHRSRRPRSRYRGLATEPTKLSSAYARLRSTTMSSRPYTPPMSSSTIVVLVPNPLRPRRRSKTVGPTARRWTYTMTSASSATAATRKSHGALTRRDLRTRALRGAPSRLPRCRRRRPR